MVVLHVRLKLKNSIIIKMFRLKRFIVKILNKNVEENKINLIISEKNNEIILENTISKNLIENNSDELLRISTENWMIDFIFGDSFKAPIQNLITNENFMVLNSLCNYGIWTLNMSQKYPNAYFYGIDYDINEKTKKLLIPKDIKFQNCIFYEWNIDERLELSLTSNFDFIYQRLFFHRIKKDQWNNIIINLKNKCKKNGWIEMVEMDTYAYNVGPLFEKFNRLAIKVTEDMGFMPRIACNLKMEFEKLDLVNIQEICKSIHIFNENDKLSNIFKDNIHDIFNNCKPLLSEKMKIDNYDNYLNEMIEECKEYKTYYNYYCVFGKKI